MQLKTNVWYSVKDSVPPFNETIIVTNHGVFYTSAIYDEDDALLHWHDDNGERVDELETFTHFMLFESLIDSNEDSKNKAEILNPELASSVKLMLSPDYKERFKAEYIQLRNRYQGLEAMLQKWDEGTLPFTPAAPRKLRDIQLRAMNDYLNALASIAQIEGIEL